MSEPRVLHEGFFKLVLMQTPMGKRECLITSDSVNLLIYAPSQSWVLDWGKVVLVRQSRPAMAHSKNPEGMITETMAGRFDVALSPRELMAKEAHEELGLIIDPDNIQLLNQGRPMALSAGAITERAYLGIACVEFDDLPDPGAIYGLKEEGEHIQPIILDVSELADYVCEDVRVFALLQYLLRALDKRSHKKIL